MSRICKDCPVAQLVESDRPKYQDGIGNGLFLQALQGLSGRMVGAVKGTKAGLTDERIEQIRQSEIKNWGSSTEEAAYLESAPEIAKAAHDCEVRIQLGQCVIHSIKVNT